MKKQLQFEIWDECNSKCTFCHLCKRNESISNSTKLQYLNNILNILKNKKDLSEYDTIGFIGGEFFQGQLSTSEIKEKFFELFKICDDLLSKNLIENIWLNVTLTIGKQKDLYDLLNTFKHINKLWLLTSFDTLGRFHTQKMLENWKYHMKNIKKLYPDIKFNTTTILTGDFIEKYLNDQINLQNFIDEYHTALFFKVPAIQKMYYNSNAEMNAEIGNFFPKRDKFLKFLLKFKKNESKELWDKLFNIVYRADVLISNIDNKLEKTIREKDTYMEDIEVENTKLQRDTYKVKNSEMDYIMPCGHLSIYNSYVDQDGCALCDKLAIQKLKS